jgi:general L-amino acid transport system substrate-binding protein
MRKGIVSTAIVTAFAAASVTLPAPAAAATLDNVRQRGFLICGVHLGLPGFGFPDKAGIYQGLDADFCRALAAAIFDDTTKVRFTPTTSANRFTAVQSGEVDVLARNATYTMSRDTTLGMNFPVINFFDGQGFMVRKSANLTGVKQLEGASICVAQGTTTEQNLADFFRAANLKYEVVTFATTEEASKALEVGRCDSFTTDSSGLAGERLKYANPEEFVILPEIISKEPLGAAVRHGDEQWTDIVRWTHYAMLNAEEYGVRQANVDEMKQSKSPEIRRLLGLEGKFGDAIGLSNDWAYRVIKRVGNYGELYERHLGEGSPLKIKRGLNDLWTRGGLQYAYPIR